MGVDVSVLILKKLSRPIGFDALEEILRLVGKEIEACGQLAEDAQAKTQDKDDDYYESIIEHECDMVEQLLGLAFVSAQIQITEVVATLKALRENIKAGRCPPIDMPEEKKQALKIDSRQVGSSGFTEVEVVNAVANYFKHGEEWPVDWAQWRKRQKPLRKDTAENIKILLAIGCKPASSGNFRVAMQALGLKYEDVHKLLTILERWRTALCQIYRQELESKNLTRVAQSP